MLFFKKNSESSEKILSIGLKITAWMTGSVVIALLVVGYFTYKKVSKIDEDNYDDKIANVIDLTDKAIETYFKDIVSVTEIFSKIDLIREPTDEITTYVNKSSPNGKVPMVYDDFYEYEKQVYNLEKAFVMANDSIIGISVALESNGAFVRYPEEPRSNNYDSRVRSWYKNAKAKNGKVNISDAYIASAGYRAIVFSVYFNDLEGNPRGVISIDANVDYLGEILKVTQNAEVKEDEKFILVDKKGSMVVNHFDESKEFTNIKDWDIPELSNWNHGDDTWFETEIDGVKYEFWTYPTKTEFFEGDYIVAIPNSLVYAADNAVLHTVIIVTIIAIVICTLIAFVLSYSIITPLKNTVKILKGISEGDGDLTQRLPVTGRNELTLVSKYFNMTFDKISGVVKSVIQESVVMNNVSENLSGSMAETASAINEISSNVASVKNEVINQSAGVEQTSATINQINNNIEKLTQNIENQSNAVSQSSSAVEQMVANIRSVTDILDKNERAVMELSDSAENGRAVVNKAVSLIDQISSDSEGLMEASTVIQNIASQTNLLAMNAAIEAAHAGDVGKGFSVVADEIRKLAEDSSTQGKRISDALVGLKDLISNVGGASKEIQSQFNVIFDNTQKVSQQESVIKSAMDEQNAGSQQILNAMQEITSITSEVKQGAVLMEQGGKEILVEMNKLATVTSEISGSMNEMSAGISDINNAMQAVNEKTVENSDSIAKVNSEIGKFKV